MASHSFFDTTQSETSQVSSDDVTDSNQCEASAPEHPRLSELKKVARREAEHQHTIVESRKLKKGKDKRGRITKSKRQTSNIRSAEICRAAKGIYIECLEKQILGEEEVYLQMMKDLLDQSAENLRLEQRIAHLEEQWNIKEAQESCSQLKHVESAVSDEVADDFFRAPGRDDMQSQWDHQRDGCANPCEGNIEMCDVDGDEWMDFSEVTAPSTPPPPSEVEVPRTPQNENRCPIEYNQEKILRSPVTIFDLEQELERESPCLKL